MSSFLPPPCVATVRAEMQAAETISITAPKVLPRAHRLNEFSPLIKIDLTGLEVGQNYTVRLWLLEADSGNYHLGSTQTPASLRVKAETSKVAILIAPTRDVFDYSAFLFVARLFEGETELGSDEQRADAISAKPPRLNSIKRLYRGEWEKNSRFGLLHSQALALKVDWSSRAHRSPTALSWTQRRAV